MQRCKPEKATLEDLTHAYYLAQEVCEAFSSLYQWQFKEADWEKLINGPQQRLWLALKALDDL
jgi:hypothetical protein